MKKFYQLFLSILFSFLFFTQAFSQITVTLGTSKDNTLYEIPHGTVSNGAGQHFFAGLTAGAVIRRGVIAFDLASNIPPCAVIQSVSLKLYMSKTNFNSGSYSVKLHRLLADWGEGASAAFGDEGQGTQAESNDATWDHTFYPSGFWTTNGGDYSNTVSATANVNQIGFYTWGSNPQLVSDVQNWVNGSVTNYGWILIGDEINAASAKRFDTKENDSINFRPSLTVTYTINKVVLNLTSIIDGFWDGSAMVADTAKVFLRNISSPYAKVDSSKTFLNSAGKSIMCFNNAASGQYYIVFTHRNSIATWSATGQSFTSGSVKSYDFTTAASQAFGNNLVLHSGKYCVYNGDVNLDEIVDIGDIVEVYNDATQVISGYVPTDINGDDFVDVTDLLISFNNTTNVVSVIKP